MPFFLRVPTVCVSSDDLLATMTRRGLQPYDSHGFAAPEEAATYTMLRPVLNNHLATTALSREDALNVVLDLFCELCALYYADICRAPGPVLDAERATMDIPGLVLRYAGSSVLAIPASSSLLTCEGLATGQSFPRHTHRHQPLSSLRIRCGGS
jgi:hypothetical protein